MNLFFALVGKEFNSRTVAELAQNIQLPHSGNYHPLSLKIDAHCAMGSAGFRDLPPQLPFYRKDYPIVVGELRLDNRAPLLNSLYDPSHPPLPSDLCDEELISLWITKQPEINCSDLYGDFAWVAWCPQSQSLVAARDSFGMRPLYYYENERLVAVSNFIGLFAQLPGFISRPDPEAIADFLLFEFDRDLTRTGLYGVKRLAPGRRLSWTAQGFTQKSFDSWPRELIRLPRPQDYIERFSELFQDSVSNRLRNQTQASILMSGGLDSTSVAAMACSVMPSKQLLAVTGTCEELFLDRERHFSSLAADSLQLPIHHLALDRGKVFSGAGRLLRFSSAPIQALLPQDGVTLMEEAAGHGPVVLTGLPGDTVLKSEPLPYLRLCLQRGEWPQLLCEFYADSLKHHRLPPLGFRSTIRHRLDTQKNRPVFPYWLDSDYVKKYQLGERWKESLHPVFRPGLRPQMMEILFSAYWPHYFESQHHAVTGLNLEFRHPFLDRALLEFLLSIPPIPWFFNKEILRESMRDRLPESIRLRPKTPLSGDPIRTKLNREWIDLSEIPSNRADLSEFIDLKRLPTFSESIQSRSYSMHLRPICLLSWLRSHKR